MNADTELDNSNEKFELAKLMFQSIIDGDKHVDEKNGRTLSAMAFLTAASAAVFSSAYSMDWPINDLQKSLNFVLSPMIGNAQLPDITQRIINNLQNSYQILGFSIPLIFFSLSLVFVILGSFLYLRATGPNLNLPNIWGYPIEEQKANKISSLLFYFKIAKYSDDDWNNEWCKSSKELKTEIINNFTFEGKLIAEQTNSKYILMEKGNLLFYFSFFWWIGLISFLLAKPNMSFFIIFFIIGELLYFIIWKLSKNIMKFNPRK